MFPIKREFLPKDFVIDIEELRRLMEKNGYHNYRDVGLMPSRNDFRENVHNKNSLREEINDLSNKHNFQIPKEPSFYSFFKLDDIDFLDTYLYLPEFSHMLHFPHSSLESVTNIAKGLTEIFPIPLIAIYVGKRWKIPKLQLYENGKLSRLSEGFVGEHEYNQKWLNGFWDRIMAERTDRSIEAVLGGIKD